MNYIASLIVAGSALSASAQAQAADWWCVLGAPDAPEAQFVDADTAIRTGNRVQIQVVGIDAAGRARSRVETLDCGAQGASPADRSLRDFACGSNNYRMNNGVILGSMTPVQAAHVIFSSRSTTPQLTQATRPEV